MSTKSLLINFAGYPNTPRMLVPDNGLASLAGALTANGHVTTILDYSTIDTIRRLFPYEYRDQLHDCVSRIMKAPSPGDLERFRSLKGEVERQQQRKVAEIAEEIVAQISRSKIDFVGFKLWAGDGFEGSLAIARTLKERFPSLPLFAGGPHVDWFGERILERYDVFDALSYGDGEEVIVRLAEYVKGKGNLASIPNLIYKSKGEIVSTPARPIDALGGLPLPVYDEIVYPAMKGDQKIKMLLVDESRGCPNGCSFCLHPMKSGSRWRMKSPEAIVNEIQRDIVRYGTRMFRFSGSNTPKSLLLSMARLLLQRRVAIEYVAFANSGADLSYEEAVLLRQSGCFGFWFGVESGNDEILARVMNKRETAKQIGRKMKDSRKAGIFVTGSIIVPAPGETEASRRDTLEFLLDVHPDSVVADPAVVIPGTKWEREAERYGIEIRDREAFIEAAMFYKMNVLYPPSLLEPFPYYRINGKSDREMFRETGSFIGELERKGILTQVTVDTALMAKYAGISPREFRDMNRVDFASGDASRISAIVEKINENCGGVPHRECA